MLRILQLALIGCFVAAISAHAVALAFGLRAERFENRALAEFPAIRWRSYAEDDTSAALGLWIRDRLPLRQALVALHNRAVHRFFGDSPVDDLRLGRDETWFLARTIYESPCAAEAEPERVIGAYRTFIDAAYAAGKTPLVAFSPDKAEMYPELLSDADRARYESCAEPRRARLEEHARSALEFVDLWSPLRAEKARLRSDDSADPVSRRLRTLYRPSDRHWHFETGRVHSRAIADAIAPGRFDRVPQPALEGDYSWMQSELSRRYLQFEINEPYTNLSELPPTLRLEKDLRFGAEHAIRHYHQRDPNADPRRVLVIHDSFIYTSYPFLAAPFRRTTFVHWQTLHEETAMIQRLLADSDVIVVQTVDSNRGHHRLGLAKLSHLLGKLRSRSHSQAVAPAVPRGG